MICFYIIIVMKTFGYCIYCLLQFTCPRFALGNNCLPGLDKFVNSHNSLMATLHNFPPGRSYQIIHLAVSALKFSVLWLRGDSPPHVSRPVVTQGLLCHRPRHPSAFSWVCLPHCLVVLSFGWRVFWERGQEGQVIYDLPCLKASFMLPFLLIVWV